MTQFIGKLVCAMMDPVMLGVTDINETVVTASPIGMNDGLNRDATANNGL